MKHLVTVKRDVTFITTIEIDATDDWSARQRIERLEIDGELPRLDWQEHEVGELYVTTVRAAQ